jgi:hypothetical protein
MSSFSVALVVLACGVAALGMFLLTPATQGVGVLALACLFAIFARIAQAASRESKPHPAEATSTPVGFIRPPANGPWPPAVGERMSLRSAIELRATPNRDGVRAGIIPANARFAIVTVQPGWLFVQSEDGQTEGWLQIVT